ncbi:MAG: DUF4382 domain-containing protein [Planctomycetota bacterium]
MQNFLFRFAIFLLAVSTCSLTGCGGGGGSGGGAGAAAGEGNLQIALTDAATDLVDRFEVDVVSIELEHRNGARVETLPVTTRIDFAELVDLAELVRVTTVPNGAYRAIWITLDFDDAVVHIAGASVDADVLDVVGQPLDGPITIALELDGRRPLVVSPGQLRLLTLDFDLDASLTVDEVGNSVTVAPVWRADLDLDRDRINRIRGPLVGVDVARDRFTILVRPFRALSSDYGTVRVEVDADTHYEINGDCYTGRDGLDALAAVPALTATTSVGRFKAGGRRFVAEEVLAGSSVPGGTLDVVRGYVTARNGNTLTLVGAQLDRDSSSITLHTNVTIELDPTHTLVTKRLSTDAQDTGDISVGQRLLAFGEITGAPGSFVMATTTHVRLIESRIAGTIVSVGVGELELALSSIGHRSPTIFDFSGTGGGGGDADPNHYIVTTGALDLTGFSAGTAMRAFGFVAPFGAAPPDFTARTLVDVSATAALLHVVWASDSTEQTGALDASGFELDLSESPFIHHVDRGGATTDLTTFASVTVAPGAGIVFGAIVEQGAISLYSDFGDFSAALAARLDAGRELQGLWAIGHFDDATAEFSATVLSAVLVDGP